MSTWTKFLKNGYVGGNTTLEKMLNKTLLLFPSKNIDQTKLSFLATRLNTSGNVLIVKENLGWVGS